MEKLHCFLLFGLLSLPSLVHSACDVNKFACKTADGRWGACDYGTCIVIRPEVRDNLRLSIIVKYPERNMRDNIGKDLYMRGNAFGFNWQRGIILNKTNSDTWQANILYQSTDDGFSCQNCADNSTYTGNNFEYRIYRDDKVDMLGGNFQIKLPISQASSLFNDAPVFYAFPWFFTKEGTASVIPIASPQIGKNKSILLYTPPSFYENTYKTYPTILAFDVDEVMYNVTKHLIGTPIVEKQTVSEYIMVGFGDYLMNGERASLLTQMYSLEFKCNNGSFDNRCNGCLKSSYANHSEFEVDSSRCGQMVKFGGQGNDTLDYLTQTVLPRLKNITSNRMLTDQPHLGILGFSFGGLMACHAAWTRPKVFGFAACQSPYFPWPDPTNQPQTTYFFTNVSLQDSNLRTNRPYQRIYMDVGGSENPSAMIAPLMYVKQELLGTGWFVLDANLWVDIYPGNKHNFRTWMSRIWKPLKVLLPARPAPRQKISTDVKYTTPIAAIPIG